MAKERRATSAVKTLKYNYQLKEGVRSSKVTNKQKGKKPKTTTAKIRIFFFHVASRVSSSPLGVLRTGATLLVIQDILECPRVPQEVEAKEWTKMLRFLSWIHLFLPKCLKNGLLQQLPFPVPEKGDVMSLGGRRGGLSIPRKRDHFVLTGCLEHCQSQPPLRSRSPKCHHHSHHSEWKCAATLSFCRSICELWQFNISTTVDFRHADTVSISNSTASSC